MKLHISSRTASLRTFIITAFVSGAVIYFVCFFYTSSIQQHELETKLDAYEMHFDADSYFIVINAKYDDLGVYYGYEPLKHFKISCDWDKSKYVCELKDLTNTDIILSQDIITFLEDYNFPDSSPTVIIDVEV
jgi:hypothetical protein